MSFGTPHFEDEDEDEGADLTLPQFVGLLVSLVFSTARVAVTRTRKHSRERQQATTAIMGFLHLFIVNKSGGLILHRPLSAKAPKLGTNEWLRIGSTFHSLYAIAVTACPIRLPNGKNECKTCLPRKGRKNTFESAWLSLFRLLSLLHSRRRRWH